jgi:RNA polymerase sigma factor (sigma-70 family)
MSIERGRAPPERDGFDWETLRAGLRLTALRRTRDADAADEATQEVLARTVALVREREIADRDEIARIAHGIARHVLADQSRKWARFRNFVTAHEASGPPHAAIDALTTLISAEEQLRLRRAWDTLSPGDRVVLRRTFFEQMSPGALARELHESPERTRKRKSRALARLREAFFGLSEAPGREAASGRAASGRAASGHAAADAPIYEVQAIPLRELG